MIRYEPKVKKTVVENLAMNFILIYGMACEENIIAAKYRVMQPARHSRHTGHLIKCLAKKNDSAHIALW